MNISTFLGLKNQVLNFLNFSSSRVLLSYKPLSHKKTCTMISILHESGWALVIRRLHSIYSEISDHLYQQ